MLVYVPFNIHFGSLSYKINRENSKKIKPNNLILSKKIEPNKKHKGKKISPNIN